MAPLLLFKGVYKTVLHCWCHGKFQIKDDMKTKNAAKNHWYKRSNPFWEELHCFLGQDMLL